MWRYCTRILLIMWHHTSGDAVEASIWVEVGVSRVQNPGCKRYPRRPWILALPYYEGLHMSNDALWMFELQAWTRVYEIPKGFHLVLNYWSVLFLDILTGFEYIYGNTVTINRELITILIGHLHHRGWWHRHCFFPSEVLCRMQCKMGWFRLVNIWRVDDDSEWCWFWIWVIPDPEDFCLISVRPVYNILTSKILTY